MTNMARSLRISGITLQEYQQKGVIRGLLIKAWGAIVEKINQYGDESLEMDLKRAVVGRKCHLPDNTSERFHRLMT